MNWPRYVLLPLSLIFLGARDLKTESRINGLLSDLPISLLESDIGARLQDISHVRDFFRSVMVVNRDEVIIDGKLEKVSFLGTGIYQFSSGVQFEISYRLKTEDHSITKNDRVIASLQIRPLQGYCLDREHRNAMVSMLGLAPSRVFFGIYAKAYTVTVTSEIEEVLVLVDVYKDSPCFDSVAIHLVHLDGPQAHSGEP